MKKEGNKNKIIVVALLILILAFLAIFILIKINEKPKKFNLEGIMKEEFRYCDNSSECMIGIIRCPGFLETREAINTRPSYHYALMGKIDEKCGYKKCITSNSFGDTLYLCLKLGDGAVCVNHKCYIEGEEPK